MACWCPSRTPLWRHLAPVVRPQRMSITCWCTPPWSRPATPSAARRPPPNRSLRRSRSRPARQTDPTTKQTLGSQPRAAIISPSAWVGGGRVGGGELRRCGPLPPSTNRAISSTPHRHADGEPAPIVMAGLRRRDFSSPAERGRLGRGSGGTGLCSSRIGCNVTRLSRNRSYPAFPNASGLVTRTGLPSRNASAFSTLCG